MADYYLYPEQTYNKDGFYGLIPITSNGVNLIPELSNYNLITGIEPLEDLVGSQELQLIQYPEELKNISNYGSNILQIIAYLNSVYTETNYGINNLILYLFLVSVMSSFNVGNWKIKNPPFVNVQIANYVSTNTSKANYRLTHVVKDF